MILHASDDVDKRFFQNIRNYMRLAEFNTFHLCNYILFISNKKRQTLFKVHKLVDISINLSKLKSFTLSSKTSPENQIYLLQLQMEKNVYRLDYHKNSDPSIEKVCDQPTLSRPVPASARLANVFT